MMFNQELEARILAFLQAVATAGQRVPVLVSGDKQWTLMAIRWLLSLVKDGSVLWYSERAPVDAWVLPAHRINHELGREAAHGVFDLYSGFHPDALAALSGSVQGGGLLFILCPPLEQWSVFQDPMAKTIAVEPWGVDGVKPAFLTRASWLLSNFPNKALLSQQGEFECIGVDGFSAPGRTMLPLRSVDDWGCVTGCQRRAVEAVLHVVSGHRKRPLVIEADRGRGKSSAMGIAVARLMAAGKRVIVTAPRRENVGTLLYFAGESGAVPGSIQFYAPDTVLAETPHADLLLVDEAAAIAPEMLKSMLAHYSRAVLATTVNGYEGTGRGFAIRFQRYLDVQYPGWNRCLLEQPIRWQQGDWLEQCLNPLLLLKPEVTLENGDGGATDLEFSEFHYQCSERFEQMLNNLFELMIAAHYRTRPSDLRILLDGGNLRVFLLHSGKQVKAVALVAEEGGITGPLSDGILAGARRPHGQVLPQSLAVHLEAPDALVMRHWRVVRIAVQPDHQGQGLGSALLQKVSQQAVCEGIDVIGSLFSGNAPVLKFWQHNVFSVVRVGYTRESTTGAHSLLVLRGLSDSGCQMAELAIARFQQDFPYFLLDTHRNLPPELVCVLLQGGCFAVTEYERDQGSLERYLSDYTPYENVVPGLWRLMWNASHGIQKKDPEAPGVQLVVIKLLQNRSWEECIALLKLKGKKHAQNLLRQSIAGWLQYHASEID